jgi:hypothetical protein
MDVTLLVELSGVLVAIVVGVASLALAVRHRRRDLSPAKSQAEFKAVRAYLNANRVLLSRQALRLYKNVPNLRAGIDTVFGPVPVLIGDPSWLPETPVDLGQVLLSSEPGMSPAARPRTWPGQRLLSDRYLPLGIGGIRWDSYFDAIQEVDPPELFFDDECYRLVGAPEASCPLTFTVGTSRYFDYIQTCEALAYEFAYYARNEALRRSESRKTVAANSHSARPTFKDLPYREELGPQIFPLTNRAVSLGVNTLTLCVDESGGRTFLMHQRDAHKVASAGAVFHVVPAGEFQPATPSPASVLNDLDLWKTIMREYAEELLGVPEDRSTEIDYKRDQPYDAFSDARRNKKLRVYYLGFVMDPLNLKGDILTACVFDRSCFSEIFGAELSKYDDSLDREGTLLLRSRKTLGIAFDELNVRTYLSGDITLPAGAATLAQAWVHRDRLR